MLVYICCSGGATSSLFCSKIGQASDEKVLVEHIFIVLQDLEHLMDKLPWEVYRELKEEFENE